MARGKKRNAQAEPDTQEEEASPENLQWSYQGCTFPVYSMDEGRLFLRLSDLKILPPRHFDWELVDSLHIRTPLIKYLKALSLYTLAERVWNGYDALC